VRTIVSPWLGNHGCLGLYLFCLVFVFSSSSSVDMASSFLQHIDRSALRRLVTSSLCGVMLMLPVLMFLFPRPFCVNLCTYCRDRLHRRLAPLPLHNILSNI
jgi:hypothetical protein